MINKDQNESSEKKINCGNSGIKVQIDDFTQNSQIKKLQKN